MKKTIVLLTMLFISQSGFAAVDSQYMKSEQFLYNIGYSKDAAKQVKVVADDPYREPYAETNDFKNIARRVYHYIVPGQEADLDFYNHSGDFNGWSWKDY